MGRVPKKYWSDENGVKKGPWSAEEDEKLVAYISRYGIWNWNHMPKAAGLLRTGKSCRLRWMNHLRPNIRHGNFTKEEEEIIIKWHRLLGNRWSAIAEKLRGRTDNEVKNYWNTRLKKQYDRNNINFNNAVNPSKFPAITCDHDLKSVQDISSIKTNWVPNESPHEDQLKLSKPTLWEAPTVVANDFSSSSSTCSSSNDTSPLGLDDALQSLLTQMFPEEEDTYMALTDHYHGKSGYTSTLVASEDNDGTTDHFEDFIFDYLWES